MAVQYDFPTSSSSSTGTWQQTYTTGSGGEVIEINGVSYGNLLNAQSGQFIAIDTMGLQTYGNAQFNNNQQIVQLSNPINFDYLDSNGNDQQYNLIPTVDPYQYRNSLKYLSLFEKSNIYVFDGQTSLTYVLEPYAEIDIYINYTTIKDIDFSNPEKVRDIILDRNKRMDEIDIEAQERPDISYYGADGSGSEIDKIRKNKKTALMAIASISIVLLLMSFFNGENIIKNKI